MLYNICNNVLVCFCNHLYWLFKDLIFDGLSHRGTMSGWTSEQAVSLMSLLALWSNSVIRVKSKSWMMKERWAFKCVPLIIVPKMWEKTSFISVLLAIFCLFPHIGASDLSSECYKHQAHAPNLHSWGGGHDPSRGPEWSWYPQKSPDPLQWQGHICKHDLWHFSVWFILLLVESNKAAWETKKIMQWLFSQILWSQLQCEKHKH